MEGKLNLREWVGREQQLHDIATRAPLDGLAALLECPRFESVVPPLAHWLFFLPHASQSQLGTDGHPHGGDFLPPALYPRRMWAGGRVEFLHDIQVGSVMNRRSRITAIESKIGRGGPMQFVTLLHELSVGGVVAIRETQDLVYRAAQPSSPPPVSPIEQPAKREIIAERERNLVLDGVALFRFSALTFNAHRIHYDRDYAREVEGYPGLVVHGPFLAMLLMHFSRDLFSADYPAVFRYRAMRPLFEQQPFKLLGTRSPQGAKLWITDQTGNLIMDGEAVDD